MRNGRIEALEDQHVVTRHVWIVVPVVARVSMKQRRLRHARPTAGEIEQRIGRYGAIWIDRPQVANSKRDILWRGRQTPPYVVYHTSPPSPEELDLIGREQATNQPRYGSQSEVRVHEAQGGMCGCRERPSATAGHSHNADRLGYHRGSPGQFADEPLELWTVDTQNLPSALETRRAGVVTNKAKTFPIERRSSRYLACVAYGHRV